MQKLKVFVLTLAAVCFALFVTACSGGTDGVSGEIIRGESLISERVRTIGRTEYSDGKINLYNTATGVTVKFTGTRLAVTFQAENALTDDNRPYFTASVDGEIPPAGKRFAVTQPVRKITVAENLAYGAHVVTVLKESEPEHGLTAVTEIETDGKFLAVPESKGLKFQILGGSGISGHGCLGSSGEEWTTENSSSLRGFGYLAARAFGAECQFVSNSGMGLVWGYRNVTPLTLAYEATGLVAEYNADGSTKSVKGVDVWAHESWSPDVVIANIGGNDYNSHINLLTGEKRAQAEAEFKAAVVSLLDRIHALYPSAKIVWTCNSVKSGNGALAYGAAEKLSYRSAVKFVELSGEKNGADNHADAATQVENADRVIAALTEFGFNPVRENIKA